MVRWSSSLVLLATLVGARADDAPKVQAPEKAPAKSAKEALPDLKDSAFDSHLDLDALSSAWGGLEPGALADIVTKLNAGERSVGRANPKLPADKLFDAALRVAAEKRDVKALQRLADEAEKMKRDDLHQAAVAALRLARGSRAADPALTPGEKHSAETNIQLRLYLDAIQAAKLNADADTLKELEQSLPDNPHLTGETATAMKKLIRDTLAALPKEQDPSTDLLRQLAKSSRGGAIQAGQVAIDLSGSTGNTIPLPPSSGLPAGAGTPVSPIGVGTVAIHTAPPSAPTAKATFTILNLVTQYNVAFDLVSPDGKHVTCYIRPNYTGQYTITYTSGRGSPAIKIWQVGGKAPLLFSVANGGRYEFLMDSRDGNRIKNYYR